MNAGSDLEVASRFSVSPRTLLDEFFGISSCRSWTRLLTARCCAVLVMVQTAHAVLDKVVDLPVIVQVQGMVQTVQISCSSWTRSLTCPLLCMCWFVVLKTVEIPQLQHLDKVVDVFGFIDGVDVPVRRWSLQQ